MDRKGKAERLEVRPEMSLREARVLFDRDTGYSRDDNQRGNWTWITVGGGPLLPRWATITYPFPNTRGRKVTIEQHDLHHVLTGYPTTWRGEGLIASWELASNRGFGWNLTAWWCILNAMLVGLIFHPHKVVQAFRRGLRYRNLFGEPYDDALLAQSVGNVRLRLGIDWVGERAPDAAAADPAEAEAASPGPAPFIARSAPPAVQP